jgi:hypothetical protein
MCNCGDVTCQWPDDWSDALDALRQRLDDEPDEDQAGTAPTR